MFNSALCVYVYLPYIQNKTINRQNIQHKTNKRINIQKNNNNIGLTYKTNKIGLANKTKQNKQSDQHTTIQHNNLKIQTFELR